MKRCPECRRDYYDDSLLYCLDDGSGLLEGPGAALEEPTALFRDVPHVSDPASSRKERAKQRKTVLLVSGVALSILIGLGLGYRNWAPSSSRPIDSIAVMPFSNDSGNPDLEYLSDGMTETLISSLSQLSSLKVKARSSVFRYKGKDVDLRRISQELSVQAILTGRVVQRAEHLTVYIELTDAANENVLWKADYDRPVTDLVSIQKDIVRDVSEKLKIRLSNLDEQSLAKGHTKSVDAYQAYLKGRFLWNRPSAPSYNRSPAYFQEAIDSDPTYPLPYVGLADYYGYSAATGALPPEENWPKAEAAADKALALDEMLAETYNPLAAVKVYYRRDWPAAEGYFQRGIALNPNFPEIRNHYALCLILVGRNDDALSQVQAAVDLDPLAPRFHLSLGRILFLIRQYDRSIEEFNRALELDPNDAGAHEWLGDVYEQKGRASEAVSEWSKSLILKNEGIHTAALPGTYDTSSFAAAIRKFAEVKLDLLNEKVRRREYVAAGEFVMVYMRLGDQDKALEWLEKAADERNRFALEFNSYPLLDKLHGHPRYQALLARAKLAG